MLGSKSRLVRVKEKHEIPTATSPPSLHSHEGDNSSSMDENSPRPATSDYHPALAEYLNAYDQQLQHRQTLGGTPGSPDELCADAMAGAIAQVTGEMNILESSGSTTSGGDMSSSGGSAVFDYVYTYGLTERKPDIDARDSNSNYRVPAYANQQVDGAMMLPQFGPGQAMDGAEPQYFGSNSSSPPQYQRHQTPPGLGDSPPITAPLSKRTHSDSSESHSHSPVPPGHTQQTQQLPHEQPHLASQRMAPTSSSMSAAQYYANALQNPHTPFSAFEPAFMAPKRDHTSNNGGTDQNGQYNMPMRPPEGPGFPVPPMQFPPLDMSTLGQPPGSIDLNWQLMSDLRGYL